MEVHPYVSEERLIHPRERQNRTEAKTKRWPTMTKKMEIQCVEILYMPSGNGQAGKASREYHIVEKVIGRICCAKDVLLFRMR